MPAGTIETRLPPPEDGTSTGKGPKVAIFEPAARLPKAPSLGRAWEIAAQNLKAVFANAGLRGVLGSSGLRASVGTAFGRTALTVVKGASGVLLAETTAKVAARFVIVALRQKDIPEIRRLNVAMGLIAGSVASAIDAGSAAAVREVGPVLAAAVRIPQSARSFSDVVMAAVRVMAAAVRLAVAESLVPRAQAVILAKLPNTAGLERGGSFTQTPPIPGEGVRLAGIPDVAISIPGGRAFHSPQSMIAHEPLPTTVSSPAVLTVKAAGLLTTGWLSILRVGLYSLMDGVAARAREAAEKARTDLDNSLSDFEGTYTTAGSDASDVLTEMQAARAAADRKIVLDPIWEDAVDMSKAAMTSLESGFAAMFTKVLKSTTTFAKKTTDVTTHTLGPAQDATDALNDALAMDVMLIDKITAGSARAARRKQIIQMSTLAAAAAIQGSIAFAQGLAEAVAGNEVQAALHFTAAGLYGFAGGLALSYGGSARRGDRAQIDDQRREYASVTELVVVVPGYSDPARIRDEILMAVQPGARGEGVGSYAGRPARKLNVSAILAARAERGALQGAAAVGGAGVSLYLGWSGPVGATIGALIVALGLDDEIDAELNRWQRRGSRALRRLGRRLGL